MKVKGLLQLDVTGSHPGVLGHGLAQIHFPQLEGRVGSGQFHGLLFGAPLRMFETHAATPDSGQPFLP